ncbi:MAG: redoxin domain-containing protein [Planctomycetaceae bacterium]
MLNRLPGLWVCFALLLSGLPSTRLVAAELAAPLAVPLELPGVDGKTVSLAGDGGESLMVLCFLGTECPLAKLYGPRLQLLAEKYRERGVRFVGINSNRQDSIEDIRRYVADSGLTFPQAKDYDHAAADRFGITRTPEVCLLDGSGAVRYRGRIDDQYQPGLSRPEPTHSDLAMALDEMLAGKTVSQFETTAVGCLLGRAPQVSTPTKLTYCQEVSRVLQRHCVECHRAGDIGPFALTDYDEVVGWGEMMLEVIADGRMPPWHATRGSGPFVNAREMTDADKAMLREWVAGGMPYGEVSELPPESPPRAKWDLGREPDLVVSMRDQPFVVPAVGTVDYQYFVVDPGLKEDRWVVGAEVLPGNRSVVHHCIVFVRPPDGKRLPGLGWLTAYVPGQRALQMPPGMGRRIPAGSRLVFQMHYTPTGTEQADLSQLGLIFAPDSDIQEEVYTLMAINQDFEIPPGASDFAVDAELKQLPKDGKLLAMAPHMHVRGKACRVVAERDGKSELLLDVPRYDFNWQHVYALQEAIPLQSLEKIEFTAHFDNSAGNPVNPDPGQYVHWGDQTWEEMTVAFFEVARPRRSREEVTSRGKKVAKQLTDQDRQFVDELLRDSDANGDGQLDGDELPQSVRRFGFKKLDLNKDGVLSRDELEEHARRDGRQ